MHLWGGSLCALTAVAAGHGKKVREWPPRSSLTWNRADWIPLMPLSQVFLMETT